MKQEPWALLDTGFHWSSFPWSLIWKQATPESWPVGRKGEKQMGSVITLHTIFLWQSPKKWWWIFTQKSWLLNDFMPRNLAAGLTFSGDLHLPILRWGVGAVRESFIQNICTDFFFFKSTNQQTPLDIHSSLALSWAPQRSMRHGLPWAGSKTVWERWLVY